MCTVASFLNIVALRCSFGEMLVPKSICNASFVSCIDMHLVYNGSPPYKLDVSHASLYIILANLKTFRWTNRNILRK